MAVALALLASAPSRAAADALHLTWNDCGAGAASAPNADFDCGGNAGSQTLYLAVESGAPVDSVIGLELVVDVQLAGAAVPDWWRIAPGSCRDGAVTADGVGGGFTGCERLWTGEPAGGVASQVVGMPRGAPNQFRLVITLARPSNELATLAAGAVYYAARLVVRNERTTGAGACAGCADPACFVFNTALLRRPPRPEGAPGADVRIDSPAGTSNRATWQQGSGASCQSVPARRATWGAIKSLYR